MVHFYTRDEVKAHNHEDDCWVCVFDDIFDLTKLISDNRGVLATPILKYAGSSVSHWFDAKTADVKSFVDPDRNVILPYTPEGRFIHVPPPDPCDDCQIISLPWWKDESLIVGKVIAFIDCFHSFM